MAKLDITQSLFGFSPVDVQRQIDAERQAEALRRSQMTGPQSLVYQGSQVQQRQFGDLSRNLLGIEDPRVIEANAIERAKQAALPALQSGGQLAYLDALAGELERMGLTNQAVQARMLADQQRATAADQQSQIALRRAQEQKAMRPPATQPRAKIVTDLGDRVRIEDPNTGDVIYERKGDTGEKSSAEAKRYNELIALGLDPDRARAIAYKTESVDFRRELQASKESERAEKKEAQQSSIIGTIDNIMNTINTAEKQIGAFSAGTLGSPLSLIPGTSARDLAANLETIKANLGFDRLQQMRDASPTGGALGQVAVQELVALQSTVASLDNAQSPAQLRANLKKVQGHYQKWRDAVRKAQQQNQTTIGDLSPQAPAEAPQQSAVPASAPQTAQEVPAQAPAQQPRRLRFNPATERAE